MQRCSALPACILLLVFTIAPVVVHAQTSGPRLKFTPPVAAFDTASCGSESTVVVTVENIGDSDASITDAADVDAPFAGALPLPLTLQPGQSREFTLRYAPTRAPMRDSLLLRFTADNPVPTAMAFLFDVSDDMAEALDTRTRIEAAAEEAAFFLDDVMAEGAPAHEGAVYAYSASSQFRLLRGFTTERLLIEGAMPVTATGSEACTWDAMHRSITFMQTSPLRKVLICFSAASDAGLQNCGPRSAAGVISSAVASDISVYCIAFTDADADDLRDIAEQTGGSYTRVHDGSDLVAALDAIRTALQYEVPQEFVLRGEAVAPELRIEPAELLIDPTETGSWKEQMVTLHNDGTAPLHLYGMDGLPASMQFSLPATAIGMGDSAVVPLRFTPLQQGYVFGQPTIAYNGCGGGSATLAVHAVGYEPEHPDPGPILITDQLTGAFGDVDCSWPDTLRSSVSNPGTATVELEYTRSGDAHFQPQHGSIDVPAGETRELVLSVRPNRESGVFTGSLQFEYVSRRSVTTVAVTDLGVRAPEQFDAGLSHAGAVQLALGDLNAGLVTTRTLDDVLAVIASSDGTPVNLQGATGDKATLAGLRIPRAPMDSTCPAPAFSAAMDLIEQLQGDRRILFFTALGDPDAGICDEAAFAALADRAVQDGIVIHVIMLGDELPSEACTALAEATDGQLWTAASLSGLREHLALIEAARVRERSEQLMLSARSVSAELSVVETMPPFPDTRVGARSCASLSLRNTGDVTLIVSDAKFFHDDYLLDTTLPVSVAPGDSTQLQVCFAPRLPGEISSGVRFTTNSCDDDQLPVFLSGRAWDSTSVVIGGDVVVAPGGLVRIPVSLTTDVAQEFGLRELDFSITYNPTLLYPDEENPAEAPDGTPLFSVGGGRIVQGFHDGEKRATTTYMIQRSESDGPITTNGSGRIIAWLRLRAYLGNDLSTTVHIDTVHTSMAGLTLGAYGEATVRLDSLAWLEQRLVDPSALYGVSLGKHAPNPVRTQAWFSFTLREPTVVRLSVHDVLGRRIAVPADGRYDAGTHQVAFDAGGLIPGLYYYRLESPAGTQTRSMLINR